MPVRIFLSCSFSSAVMTPVGIAQGPASMADHLKSFLDNGGEAAQAECYTQGNQIVLILQRALDVAGHVLVVDVSAQLGSYVCGCCNSTGGAVAQSCVDQAVAAHHDMEILACTGGAADDICGVGQVTGGVLHTNDVGDISQLGNGSGLDGQVGLGRRYRRE